MQPPWLGPTVLPPPPPPAFLAAPPSNSIGCGQGGSRSSGGAAACHPLFGGEPAAPTWGDAGVSVPRLLNRPRGRGETAPRDLLPAGGAGVLTDVVGNYRPSERAHVGEAQQVRPRVQLWSKKASPTSM
eukprot:TRINITY_DN38771_c0_g2_i2.p2 TRINITY_DN38771_c0_g2~~TRINITY_DN38771_c0_g2_i2.p2  ORF type:complete len:129 (-),score=23.34 TRINITY_DN38771_c0_g2_i2:440-826(-)